MQKSRKCKVGKFTTKTYECIVNKVIMSQNALGCKGTMNYTCLREFIIDVNSKGDIIILKLFILHIQIWSDRYF